VVSKPHTCYSKSVGGNSFTMTLTYNNFIENLYKTFPDFRESLDNELLKVLEDNPMATFTFFVDHFYKRLGDAEFENKLIDLLDRMVGIESLNDVLDDFWLNIYSLMYEKGIDINPFLNRLASRTKRTYDLTVDMWKRGNGIKS
jgi:hypothetical protein